MSSEASIDLWYTQSTSPKGIAMKMINSGWLPRHQDQAIFLSSKDKDDFNWLSQEYNSFDLDTFINSHNDKDKIGIVLTVDSSIGGEFLFYEKYLSIILSSETFYSNRYLKIPDFTWYLSRLENFIKSVDIERIECIIHY